MEVINVDEVKAQLSKLVEMTLEGKEIVIGKRNHSSGAFIGFEFWENSEFIMIILAGYIVIF